MDDDPATGPRARDHCAAGLAQATAQLHEQFDQRLGARTVDECIAEVASRFANATVLSFVPLLVQRYVREELQARPDTIDLREHRPANAELIRAD
jgi:hypothetical protein